MDDLISRQAAIDAVNCVMVMKGIRSGKSIVAEAVESAKRIMTDNIRDLPPALPEPMKIDLSRCSEENWERIKKEWANTPVTTIPAQPTPDQNGDLWITVPDIDEVTRIYVQEGKSKFCRIFYEEQEQPEPYVGHWIPVGGALYQCDQCGVVSLKRKFCSECGAEMEATE